MLKPPVLFYEKLIRKYKNGTPFVIFASFLIIFCLSRLWVQLAMRGIILDSFTDNVDGVHIHHFAYGIFLTAIVGYLAFVLPRHIFEAWKIKLAALFGIGLGWTFDEFGMWMRLRDDYWMRQSYDAIIIISAVFVNVVYLADFWANFFRKKKRL